jgi:hypothetical protein
MPVPASIEALDVTPASNSFAGSDAANTLDEAIRSAYAFTRQSLTAGSDIASASTITPPSTGSSFDVTGTVTIAAIGSTNSWNGRQITLRFTGALTLTHSSTLVLPGATNIVTGAADYAVFRQRSSGTWDCIDFQRGAVQCAFYVSKSADQTISVANTTITFDTEAYDYGSVFSGNTFTAPVTGLYLLGANLAVRGASATSTPSTRLWVNGVATDYLYCAQTSSSTSSSPYNATALVPLTSGQTCTIRGTNSSLPTNSFEVLSPVSAFFGMLVR